MGCCWDAGLHEPRAGRGEAADTPSDIWAFGVSSTRCSRAVRRSRAPPSQKLSRRPLRASPTGPDSPRRCRRASGISWSAASTRIGAAESAIADATIAIDGAQPPSPYSGSVSDISRGRSAWLVPALAGLALIGAVGLIVLGLRAPDALQPPVPVPSDEPAGIGGSADILPDGTKVAFQWNGPNEDNFDIYRKPVGQGDPVRLTMDPAADSSPAWSPDRLMDSIQPPESFISKIWANALCCAIPAPADPNRESVPATSLGWTPDSRWLVVNRGSASGRQAGVVLVSLETREEKQLTHATNPVAPGHRGSVA